ncbi:MAG: Wzz/FepE/Etk N-terminal domain-containing protein, partial [Actinomycetota bacterium]|nr:Wzz/FepE/Etk N-terminal domain-containing protein [Actinomycetota bacterium]
MPRSDLTSDVDLRDYGRVLRRRKGIILATVLIVGVAAAGVTVAQPKVYQASAEVRLQTNNTDALFGATGSLIADPNRVDVTEIQVIKSAPVRLAAARILKTAQPPDVSVSQISGSDIVEVKSKSQNPRDAAAAANALTSAYIAFRRQQAVDQLNAAANQVQSQADALGQQIKAAQAQNGGKTSDPLLQSLVDQQATFKQRLDQLHVQAALQTGGAQLVAAATIPGTPISPRPVRNAALALIAGLVLGVGLALVADLLDDGVRTPEDLVRFGESLPLLGFVPEIDLRGRRGARDSVVQTDLNSAAGEAYRSVRTSLQLLGIDRPPRMVLVTSPLGGEGKTTTVANLGLALARSGQRVVLVDCDLRRPRLHTLFGLSNEVGLTSVLAGDVSLTDATQTIPGELNILVLASGPRPPAPPELLSSKRTADLLDDLASAADVV